MTCSSDDMGYHTCDIGPNHGARVARQHSDAQCIEGQTFGVRGDQLWVDRGCRAEFEILPGRQWGGGTGGNIVSCSSDDMGYHTCDIGRNGGVRVARQRSDARCTEGQTYGVNGNQLWVNRGCRADFEVLSYRDWNQGGNWSDGGSTITCSSDDMRRHFCNIGKPGGVRLSRQRSDAQCIEGQTWGVSGNQIWVDRGCRADFVVTERQHRDHDWDHDRDRDHDWDHDRDHDGGNSSGTRVVTCSSDDMRRHTCDVGFNSGIRMVRKRSDAKCELNRSYGFNGNQIWVDRGCRADFEVTVRNDRPGRR